MLKAEFVRAQILRLSGLSFFPTASAGVVELSDWLAKHAPDEAAAGEFIDAWLRTNKESPKPADIYEHFHPPTSHHTVDAQPDLKCQVCGDTGWRIVERKGGITAAKKCGCNEATR